MKSLLASLLIFLTSVSLAFSVPAKSTDFQSWNNLTITGKFDKINAELSNFRYEFNYQERLANDAGTSFQTLLRGGLGYNLNERHSIWISG